MISNLFNFISQMIIIFAIITVAVLKKQNVILWSCISLGGYLCISMLNQFFLYFIVVPQGVGAVISFYQKLSLILITYSMIVLMLLMINIFRSSKKGA